MDPTQPLADATPYQAGRPSVRVIQLREYGLSPSANGPAAQQLFPLHPLQLQFEIQPRTRSSTEYGHTTPLLPDLAHCTR
jgi:hypothetical protein